MKNMHCGQHEYSFTIYGMLIVLPKGWNAECSGTMERWKMKFIFWSFKSKENKWLTGIYENDENFGYHK